MPLITIVNLSHQVTLRISYRTADIRSLTSIVLYLQFELVF
jgi:hypothetical protein